MIRHLSPQQYASLMATDKALGFVAFSQKREYEGTKSFAPFNEPVRPNAAKQKRLDQQSTR